MTQKQIEKEANDYAYKNWAGGGFECASINSFIAGAEWRIDSVWHDVSEKPNFLKLPILLENKKNIHFIDYTPASWIYIYIQKYYIKWAYTKDLLPKSSLN